MDGSNIEELNNTIPNDPIQQPTDSLLMDGTNVENSKLENELLLTKNPVDVQSNQLIQPNVDMNENPTEPTTVPTPIENEPNPIIHESNPLSENANTLLAENVANEVPVTNEDNQTLPHENLFSPTDNLINEVINNSKPNDSIMDETPLISQNDQDLLEPLSANSTNNNKNPEYETVVEEVVIDKPLDHNNLGDNIKILSSDNNTIVYEQTIYEDVNKKVEPTSAKPEEANEQSEETNDESKTKHTVQTVDDKEPSFKTNIKSKLEKPKTSKRSTGFSSRLTQETASSRLKRNAPLSNNTSKSSFSSVNKFLFFKWIHRLFIDSRII